MSGREQLDWEFLGLRFLTTWRERRDERCGYLRCRRRPVAEIATPFGRDCYCPRHIELMAHSVIEYAESEGHYVR